MPTLSAETLLTNYRRAQIRDKIKASLEGKIEDRALWSGCSNLEWFRGRV